MAAVFAVVSSVCAVVQVHGPLHSMRRAKPPQRTTLSRTIEPPLPLPHPYQSGLLPAARPQRSLVIAPVQLPGTSAAKNPASAVQVTGLMPVALVQIL